MKYIKQLDSLRAVAVILVIISHWIPITNFLIPIGAIGVDIFFVLSGFLISNILFENRNKAEELNIPKSSLIKNFYVRRTLRIFPIYYLTIFILLIFSKSTETNIQSAFIYFLTYTSNFYFFDIQSWDGMLSHLWSLAVEEQFYLIWPWIILFCNKKYFLHIIFLFIFIGVFSQDLMREVPLSSVLTFTCFDAFGLGAILSWVITYENEKLKKFYRIISIVTVILFILVIIQDNWIFIPLRTIVSIITLWTITYIIIYRDTNSLKFKFILNNERLIFLGKISYGLYLYHNLIPIKLHLKIINIHIDQLFPDLLYTKYWAELLFLMENTILLIAISWLSFILIEKRFLNLKKYFEYQQKPSLQDPTPFKTGEPQKIELN